MKLSQRMNDYRNRILSTKPTICLERARYYTEIYRTNLSLPVVVKRALALKETLSNMTLVIEPEDIIVGNHSSAIYAAPIFPEYATEWIVKEIDEFEKRPGDAYFPDEGTKKELLELCTWWNGKTTLDKGRSMMSDRLREIHSAQIIRAEGNLTSGDAHIAIHFRKLLNRGLQSYLDETLHRQEECKEMANEAEIKRYHFYRAIALGIEAFQIYIKRFAALAQIQADLCTDEKRREELRSITSNCRHLITKKPVNFKQALQLCWFVQVVLQIESNGHSLSMGRLDQYLQPFLEADRSKGIFDENWAMEALTNMWLKMVSIKKIRSWSHTRFSAGGPLYQNVTIGGQTRDYKDGVNDMSFLILRSVGAARLTQPNLSVRFHPGINKEFLSECIEVIRLGFGMPAFNNDSVVLPALEKLGVDPDDAWDYSAIGCIEVAIPGLWGYRCTGKHFLNFMRVFMAVLYGGEDKPSGKTFHPSKKNLRNFCSFDELMEAWDEQVRFYAGAGIAIDSAIDIVLRDEAPDILCSAFTDNCLERGMTIHEGGCKYDFVSGLQVGIANLADSLAVIKKLIFEEQRISVDQLLEALESDFSTPQGEKVRQMLINHAPKYGNDDDYVDKLIVRAYAPYIEEIKNYRTIREGSGAVGCRYFAGTSSISGNVPAGAVVPATPDGRKSGKPLAEGASPSGGADKLGPTAVMKSISKLPTEDITGGVLLNQKMSPQMLQNPYHRQLLASLLHTFFDVLKGWHIQYNIVDRETLLAAQSDPESHRDLIVRVAGYSAFFTNLSPDTQDDIIARTELNLSV